MSKIMSRADAIEALRFPSILDNAVRAGWIKPVATLVSKRPSVAIYATKDVEGLVVRILNGEMPPNSKGKGAK